MYMPNSTLIQDLNDHLSFSEINFTKGKLKDFPGKEKYGLKQEGLYISTFNSAEALLVLLMDVNSKGTLRLKIKGSNYFTDTDVILEIK